MPKSVDATALSVFIVLFALVTMVGFAAVRWRRAQSLAHLDEWGLGGRSFGSFVTWFLLGGDLYTAYTFVAVPALVYGAGATGFFALPYTIIVYPLVFIFMPRLWSVSHRHGFVTPADFVDGRYGSRSLATAVAVTGIVATMPYIALQLVGIQVVLQAMGVGAGATGIVKDLPLIIAFAILAAYTYTSGLRAPALIAFVKDALIYLVIAVAVIYIPIKLGGAHKIFGAAAEALPKKKPVPGALIPGSKGYVPYATLALGSAMALFMYPHSITAVLATRNRNVVRRNAALLPAYSFLLGLIALLGYMAIAAHITVPKGGANLAVPLLFKQMFPSWFAGVAFAAIAIGALVPAAIMSIAAANLFTRNIWCAYVRPSTSREGEAAVAKLVSLLVKVGALVFILAISTQYALDLQLLGGIWILQTFPAIVFGLYSRWLHRWALLAGWAVGIASGSYMAWTVINPATGRHFGGSVYHWHALGLDFSAYAALIAFVLNVVVAVVLTAVFRAIRLPAGTDRTAVDDYEAVRAPALDVTPVGAPRRSPETVEGATAG